jgi:hypothetical protein
LKLLDPRHLRSDEGWPQATTSRSVLPRSDVDITVQDLDTLNFQHRLQTRCDTSRLESPGGRVLSVAGDGRFLRKCLMLRHILILLNDCARMRWHEPYCGWISQRDSLDANDSPSEGSFNNGRLISINRGIPAHEWSFRASLAVVFDSFRTWGKDDEVATLRRDSASRGKRSPNPFI